LIPDGSNCLNPFSIIVVADTNAFINAATQGCLDFPAQFTDVNSGTLPTAINDKGRWFQPDSAVFADGSTTGCLALPTMYLRC
jgi:hypothetical protein